MAKKPLITIIIVLIVILIGSYLLTKNKTNQPISQNTTITYFVSSEDSTKYCNGVDMDSAGYKATITQEKTLTLPTNNPTKTEIVKAIINASTTGMCQQVLNQLNITESNGTVTIPSIDGRAGVSIAMCSCKPEVEVNVLNIPAITNIVWQ